MNKNPNTGYTVKAEYTDQKIKEYRDNPLIEALPPIFNFEQTEELLHVYPDCDVEEREYDAHERYHCIQRLFKYFQPWNQHFDLEEKVSRVIRQGYVSRNPIKPEHADDMQKIYRMIKEGDYRFNNYELSPTEASGFAMIGFSGVGKSKAIERILSMYPQMIIHSKHKGNDLNHYQLVWMKLDCPHDGSVRGLCANFFMEIDRLLGEKTYDKFASGRNTAANTMIPRMSLIAKRHSLGLLVIDEIQHLSVAKSGGQEKMLNFFVTLVNIIGIPVILIGTTKAVSIIQGEFRQARRGSGHQGDLIWENMTKDDRWQLLIEGMWEYQWTKKEAVLTQELMDALYEESQGICDIAIKLFAMTQIRAIATGIEVVTARLIQQVGKDSLQLVRPMLLALKSVNKDQIAKYDDIRPIDIEAFCEEQKKLIDLNDKIKQKKVADKKKKAEAFNVFEEAVLNLLDFDINSDVAKISVQKVMDANKGNTDITQIVKKALKLALRDEIKKEDNKSNKKPRIIEENRDEADLRLIIEKGRRDNKSAYEALKAAGIISNPVEEFIMLG